MIPVGVHFADVEEGAVYEFGSYTVTKEEMLTFAEQYDPQPFHVDEAAARESRFGGLIASGFHTASIFMWMFVDFFVDPAESNAFPGAGLGALAWREPVRPGDTLSVRTEILRKEPPDESGLGEIHFRSIVSNQDDQHVMTLEPKGHYEGTEPETG